MTTTTKLGDYLGRALTNATPGSSAATDFIGRNVTAGDKDWLGRLLLNNPLYPPALWVIATSYTLGARSRLAPVNEVQTVTITGTPASGAFTPALNGIAATVSVPFNGTAANLDAALETIPQVGAAGVSVTGGPGPGTPFAVTFTGALAGSDVPLLTFTNTFNVGSVAATVTTGGRGIAVLEATAAGTSHASTAPVAPAVGATVVDNTVTWKRLV